MENSTDPIEFNNLYSGCLIGLASNSSSSPFNGGLQLPLGKVYLNATFTVGELRRPDGVQQPAAAVVLDLRLLPHRHHVYGGLR